MNRLVKKVLQMYIGIEWNSMDEFDGWHPAIFSQGYACGVQKEIRRKVYQKTARWCTWRFPYDDLHIPILDDLAGVYH